MAGEVSTTLQFSTVATETRYYRAVVTSEVNTPTALDQMQISLTKNANALAVGEIYYVKIDLAHTPLQQLVQPVTLMELVQVFLSK